MKQIKFILLLLIGAIVVSCNDFLTPDPVSAITTDSYYNTEAELENGLVNMYDGIQGINSTSPNDNHGIQIEYQVLEMRSDNTKTKSSEGEQAQFESYNVEATNGVVYDYYRSMYNVVYRANVVLGSLDVASDENRPAIEGEAKFVRAYAYFNLVRAFGDIPLVDRVIDPLELEIQFTRVATSQVYELIISDLETAVAGLGSTGYGRATKSAAQALLAKVYLTTKEYDKAKSLLSSVMSAGYSLEPEFKDVFYTEGNNEIIWAIVYDSDDPKNSQNYSAEWLNSVGRSSGLNYVTIDCKEFLDENGGDRTMYSYREDIAFTNGYQVAKYLSIEDENLDLQASAVDPRMAGNDWIMLRYADVLLMYAEASIGSGAATTEQAALDAFNAVRARAGFAPVPSISKEDLLNERRAELAFENHRLFDLVRFGEAQNVLSTFAASVGYSFSASDLLLPIPQREINLSKGLLSQNPGY